VYFVTSEQPDARTEKIVNGLQVRNSIFLGQIMTTRACVMVKPLIMARNTKCAIVIGTFVVFNLGIFQTNMTSHTPARVASDNLLNKANSL